MKLPKLLEISRSHTFPTVEFQDFFFSFISTPLSFSMSRLFNNLFELGHFPDLWKIAHVTAIYKRSGPKTCKSSFRPISLLPSLSKIYESVIHDRFLKHCLENNIITEKQAAYLKGDSTVSQLLYIVHNIRTNWSKNKITQGLFLDVSSAFDKVWHNGLLAKLNQIGVDGTLAVDHLHEWHSRWHREWHSNCQNPNSTNSSIQQSLRLDYILTPWSTPPTTTNSLLLLLTAQLARQADCTTVQSQTSAGTIDSPNVPHTQHNYYQPKINKNKWFSHHRS